MESLNSSLSPFNATAPEMPETWQGAFLIIILLIGLPANGFIIWLTGWRLRCRGLSVFILSLASSDFLFLCVMVMQIMETLQGDNWVLGAFMCRLRHFLLDLSYHCSLFLLAALSVDRCLLVLLPLWYHCHRPLRLSTYICLGTWVAASLLSIKGFVFPKLVLFKGFFPFVVMVTTHAVTLAHTLRRHTRAPSQFYRIVAATLTVYVLLNLPFQITQLLFLVALENQELYSRLIPFLVYTGYLINLNTSINPYIYLIFGSNLCTSCSHPKTSSLASALTEELGKSPRHTPEASFSA
nr:probable G-protein coupled receptor 152 [Pelodiscus sinensis]|eukprot:XP_014432110.1 probable G-protein coupled receptor 152 [Pelodiscus sinensis]